MSLASSTGKRAVNGTDGPLVAKAQQIGLTFGVAQTLDEVLSAWRLVYSAYLRSGLIDPNPFELHTTPRAVGPHTAVIIARLGDVVVGTLSAMLDNPGGLPLDAVYPGELAALRREGRRLMELGLFADRREQLSRSLGTLLEMMRLATYFGIHNDRTDAVIGVHPRHAGFYQDYLAFDRMGRPSTHPAVRNNAVVLLRLSWFDRLRHGDLPPGMRHVAETPVDQELYRTRFRFEPGDITASVIERYMALKASLPSRT
jgi:hypothetical protein